jgi:endoglucanase
LEYQTGCVQYDLFKTGREPRGSPLPRLPCRKRSSMKRQLGIWVGIVTLSSACGNGMSGGPQGTGGSATDGVSGGGPGAGSGGALSGAGGTSGGATSGPAGGAATGGGATGGTGGSSATGGAPGSGGTGGGSSGHPNPTLVPLHVDGNKLLDPSGKTIVLRGTSLIDIGALYEYGGGIGGITARMDKIAAAGLSGHVVRLPVYPKVTYNGGYPYCSPLPFPVGSGPEADCDPSPATTTAEEYIAEVLKPAVDAATDRNLYVIVDFHQIDDAATSASGDDAKAFWQSIAPVFADYTNVFYEAFNEPIDFGSDWSALKPKAQEWVDTIRAAAPNNVIIVPSPQWCQHPGDAASDPPTGSNLMFTAHVYPGNWNPTFQDQIDTAAAVAPLFFTEWGYDQGSSDGTTGTSDPNWGADFRVVVDTSGGSWTAWVTDDSWAPSMFTDPSLEALTPFGTLTNAWLESTAANDWVQ